jgi:hypothetical protein
MAKKVIGSLGAILASAMAPGRVGRNVVREQERQGRRQNRLDKRHTKRIEVGLDIPTKDDRRGAGLGPAADRDGDLYRLTRKRNARVAMDRYRSGRG